MLNTNGLQPRMSDPVRSVKRQRSNPSVGERSSSRSKLVMTAERVADAPGDANRMMHDAEPANLESVPDEIDDATHARLDEAVLDMDPDEPSNLYRAASLLATIASTSEGQLDPQYKENPNAKALLKEHPELMNKLKEAWEARTFREIRTLKLLQRAAPKPPLRRRSPNPPLDDLQQRAISTAWKGPYNGTYHEMLYTSLNQMDHEKPYSNTVSIVQSSGTGKSRMVDQLGRLVFTIPFNLRPRSEMQGLAFPPPDSQIGEFLSQPNCATVQEVQGYYLQFLTHVFKEIRKILDQHFRNSSSTYSILATSWRAYLESGDKRESLYESVVLASKRSWAVRAVSEENINLTILEGQSIKAFDKLSEAIDCCMEPRRSFLDKNIKVVMYFDESHTLQIPAPPSKDDKMLFDVLTSAIDPLRSRSFFAIFLSTNSHLASLAPSGPFARSARARRHWETLQFPITETPFDCSPNLSVSPGTLLLEETSTLEFMAQFGRPLFWTMVAGAGERKNDVLAIILDLARSKLLCQNDINVAHDKINAATAIVDLRLMLDYEPRREAARSAEADLVASHMRIAYSVPHTREYVRSGYPSEPLLAEAAAQQMRVFRSFDPDATVKILMDNVTSGLLDRGERGELVARELLTSAYDRAIEREFNDQSVGNPSRSNTMPVQRTPFYSRGVSLVTFIEELFVPMYAEEVLKSFPNNVADETPFRKAFENAKIRFTHFGKMADDTGTSTTAVWAALVRGMAIITRAGETLLDIIIPVLLSDSDKLCEQAVTGILISVKRRRNKGTVAKYEVDERPIQFFPPSENPTASRRPYVSLVMELGVQPSPPRGAVTRAKIKGKERRRAPTADSSTGFFMSSSKAQSISLLPTQNTPKLKVFAQGTRHHPVLEHPRYTIFAYGCSNTVYKGITPAQREKYQFLLASRDFLAEHPRQTSEALSAVRRMKPFWSAGEDCYHWIRDYELRDDVADRARADGEYDGVMIVDAVSASSEDEDLFD